MNGYCHFCVKENHFIKNKGENFFLLWSPDSFTTQALKINYCPMCGRLLKSSQNRNCSNCKWGLYDEYWKDYSCTKGVSCKDWDGWEPYDE